MRRLLAFLGLVAASLVPSLLSAPPALAIAPSGSFVRVTGTAPVYVVIGGAVIHVDSCAPLGGCPKLQKIASLAGYAAVPANGSLVRIQNGPSEGFIGRFVGGAVIHVDSCAPIGGCAGDVGLDAGGAAAYMAAHPVPANGSFVRIQNGPSEGFIGTFVGGAVIHVDSCAPVGGCLGDVGLDAGGAAAYMAAHPLPANGSFVRIQNGPAAGFIGTLVGGAVIHVDSCAPLHGCAGVVGLDAGGAVAYMAAHPVPPNGAYVRVADGPLEGLIARVAGGALLGLTNCTVLGGCPGWVSLDSGGFTDYVKAHPVPADGTLLQGLPSGVVWMVTGGTREPAGATPAVVAVDDSSLNGIPIASPATTGTGTTSPPPPPAPSGHGHRRRLGVRLRLKWAWNGGRTELVWLKVGHHPRSVSVNVSCRGKGCPEAALSATSRRLPRLLVALDRRVYRAGDRVVITLSARGYGRERVAVVIRSGRIPKVRLL
jgi:hypothetical protein